MQVPPVTVATGAELACPVTPVIFVSGFAEVPNGMAVTMDQGADSVNVQVESIYKFEPNMTFPDAGAPATTTRAGMLGLMVMELMLQELACADAHMSQIVMTPTNRISCLKDIAKPSRNIS